MLVIALRAFILYMLVVVVMRIMGKRQIGELQPFELAIAIMISELAAIPMSDTDIPLLSGVIPILTLLFAQVTLSYVNMKSNSARCVLCGRPSILIEKGRISESELRRLRLNINDLMEQLRVKNYADITKVDYAIMETNGQLSIIPKGQNRSLAPSDLNIKTADEGLPLTLIVDGKIIKHNLTITGMTEEKLYHALRQEGVQSIKEVFFASLDKTGTLHWQRKESAKP